jgi:hypothetical protein
LDQICHNPANDRNVVVVNDHAAFKGRLVSQDGCGQQQQAQPD